MTTEPTSNFLPCPSPKKKQATLPWHRTRAITALISLLALLISTAAWLFLVFACTQSGCSNGWRRLNTKSVWQGSPVISVSWLDLDYRNDHDNYDVNINHNDSNISNVDDLGSKLSLKHIVFGIAGSSNLWNRRKELVKLWWRRNEMRGYLWLDEDVNVEEEEAMLLPEVMVSEDISRFRYTNPTGHPSGLRISRIVNECFRLGLPNVRWFVLGDDDTIFNVDNLVDVLSKYDWTQMVYVGSSSESHSANSYFSHSMAFGGGGIAISRPLAGALYRIQDNCLKRYPKLYGSDDRLHACITELGIPLTRELGFHQWDIRGSAHGLLSSHPIAPFISIHHVEAVEPFYPGLNYMESLKLFTRAMKVEPRGFLQRAIYFDRVRRLTFSVSLGYVVQVFPGCIPPRELERSEQTFSAWNRISDSDEFDLDIRGTKRSFCKRPVLFFLNDTVTDGNNTLSIYRRVGGKYDLKRRILCFPQSTPLSSVQGIEVLAYPPSKNWHLLPRRLCCKANQATDGILKMVVRQCEKGDFNSIWGMT